MYLKRLELQGFKSFPEKIRLEFNTGITAIVGPNGSGKSNISDAVRWVLGEQSAKSLRGAKMEDVIFAGTQSRRQLGFAEVIMVIDNADRKLAMDFSEVTVSRRVFRSGESEYQINGLSCRLKDIHEMFMDTGIGKEGYSIIGQGRIEEILSSRSEDRRLLFEEAAGIVKYKTRKHETENKLERERQNLVRVEDIISEISGQLEPMREQAEKARKYFEYKEQLKSLQVNIFIQNVERAESELKKIDDSLNTLKNQVESEKIKQDRYMMEIESAREESQRLETKAKEYNEQLNDIRLAIGSNDNDIKLLNEQIGFILQEISRLNSDIEEKQNKIQELEQSMTTENAKLSGIEIKLKVSGENYEQKQQSFNDVSRRMSEGEQQIEKFNAEIIEKMGTSSEMKVELQNFRRNYQQLEDTKENVLEEKEINRSKLNEKNARASALHKSLEITLESIEKLTRDSIQLQNEKEEKTKSLNEKSARLVVVQKELNQSGSRLKALIEFENGYEGYYNSVKSVLKQKKREPERFKGICGAVAELMEVNKDYEVCLEVALGSAVQNIVTLSEEDATLAIEYLKSTKDGRATFLPLTAIKGRDLGNNKNEILGQVGVCGVAKDLIQYDPRYENIFSSLLGRVIVVDNIKNAVKLARKYEHQYKIVTLEGELLNAGGAMSGGSSTQKIMNLFSRSREIKELKELVDKLDRENLTLTTETEGTRRVISIIKEQIEDKRTELQEKALERATLEQNLSQTKEQIELFKLKSVELQEADQKLMERLQEINKEIRQKEKNLAEHESSIQKLHEQVDEFQNAMINERLEKESGYSELMQIKTEISALEQNKQSSNENIYRMQQEKLYIVESVNKHGEEIHVKAEKKQSCEESILTTREKIQNLKVEQDALLSKISDAESLKQALAKKLSENEKLERELMETLSILKSSVVRLEAQKEQTNENNRRIYDEMWDEYQITYNTALGYERLELTSIQLQRNEKTVKADINSLGNINSAAIDEFKAITERHTFLTKQRDDIVATEEKLKDIIEELTGLMEKQFIEQFRIISENFSVVFSEMFGGGKAYLRLSDEKNVLDSGIDIIAQPPGKNLQNMLLLSGGERALTATALLFGILRMKPSPFCILDEVEAALDDANVLRYANYLKKFSSETQFIIVTHRKGTMESADVLYGVTMEEHGVSKLSSIKLTE